MHLCVRGTGESPRLCRSSPNPITSRPKSTSSSRDALSVSLALRFKFVCHCLSSSLPHYHLCLSFLFHHLSHQFSHYIPIPIAFISVYESPPSHTHTPFHLSSQQLLAFSVTQSILMIYTVIFSSFPPLSYISLLCLICGNILTKAECKCKCRPRERLRPASCSVTLPLPLSH